MSSSLSGRQLVFLASIDWPQTWQRHQALASAFAAQEAEVFFVENTGFRGLRPKDAKRLAARARRLFGVQPGGPASEPPPLGVKLFAPAVLPPTAGIFRSLNSRLLLPSLASRLRAAGLRDGAVVFVYLPTATSLSLLDLLKPATVIYDCVDNFSGHPTPPADLKKTETELLRRSALVLTTSPTLFAAYDGRHPRVREIHHGVSGDFFLNAPARGRVSTIAYFGTIWSVLDYAPIAALAEAGFLVSLIGPVKEAPPPLPPGVVMPGPLPRSGLPSALGHFDALILPYADIPYNRGVLPAKIYECLATGLPVLASPLPALEPLRNLLRICKTGEEFVAAARGLAVSDSEDKRRARIAAANAHRTELQAEKIAAEIAAAESKR